MDWQQQRKRRLFSWQGASAYNSLGGERGFYAVVVEQPQHVNLLRRLGRHCD